MTASLFMHKGKLYDSLEPIEEDNIRTYVEQRGKSGSQQTDSHNQDLADELVTLSGTWCDRIAHHIRCAYDHLNPSFALTVISSIWERVDRLSDLAAARSRLLHGRVNAPELSSDIDDLGFLATTDENGCAANISAIDATSKMLRASRSALHGQLPAVEISKAPMGHVFVNWNAWPLVIQWEVLPSPFSWPGVTVRVVSTNPANAGTIQSRIFHNGADVVEHLRQQLEHN